MIPGSQVAGTLQLSDCTRAGYRFIYVCSIRNDHDLVPRAEIGGFSPPHVLQVHTQSGVTERESGTFLCVAPLPHHLEG